MKGKGGRDRGWARALSSKHTDFNKFGIAWACMTSSVRRKSRFCPSISHQSLTFCPCNAKRVPHTFQMWRCSITFHTNGGLVGWIVYRDLFTHAHKITHSTHMHITHHTSHVRRAYHRLGVAFLG